VAREDGRGTEIGCAAGLDGQEAVRPEPAGGGIGVLAGSRAVARDAVGWVRRGWVRRGWLLGWRSAVRFSTFLRSAVGSSPAKQPAA
jgi:hypothetical protein